MTNRKTIQQKLMELAEQDGCQTSIQAAKHIDYLEDILRRNREYQDTLRRRLAKQRRKRELLQAEIDRLRAALQLLIQYEYHDADEMDGAELWFSLIEAAHEVLGVEKKDD